MHHSLSWKTSPFIDDVALSETSIAPNIGRGVMIMQSNTSLKMLHQALPTWVLTSTHFIFCYDEECLKPTTTTSLHLSVNEKTVKTVLKVLANSRGENMLTICDSSPPFWNYDQVEYGSIFFFSKWLMASPNATYNEGVLLTTCTKLWLNAFIMWSGKQITGVSLVTKIEFRISSNVLNITLFFFHRGKWWSTGVLLVHKD